MEGEAARSCLLLSVSINVFSSASHFSRPTMCRALCCGLARPDAFNPASLAYNGGSLGRETLPGVVGARWGLGGTPWSVTNTLLWTRVPLATEYFITGVRGVLRVIVQKGSAKETAGGSEGGVSLVTDEEL